MSSYILDGLKEAIIHYIDPSKLSDNPLEGLRQKETILKQLTDCFIRDNLDPGEYEELEELIANTMKGDYTSVVLGRITQDDLTRTLPTMTITDACLTVGTSSSSSGCGPIGTGEETIAIVTITGGDIPIELFTTWEWIIGAAPKDSSVTIVEGVDETILGDREKTYFLSFSDPGYYTLAVRVYHQYIDLMYIQTTLMVQVV
jgi:hypothetical protein